MQAAPLEDHIVVGIHVSNRYEDVQNLQHVLTEGGQYIRTRLGCHGLLFVSKVLC